MDFRTLMEQRWRDFEQEASASKAEGNLANILGQAWYRALSADHRHAADLVLADWLLEGTTRQQSYALSLIWEFRIRDTAPALHQLLQKLEGKDPVSRDRRKLVQRVIGVLDEVSQN